MKIDSFVTLLELLKLAVRKPLLSDNVHTLSDSTLQSHTYITINLWLVLYERPIKELPVEA